MTPGVSPMTKPRRLAQHEGVKEKLEDDVHARIAREAAATTPADEAEFKSVAASLKHKATVSRIEQIDDVAPVIFDQLHLQE